MTAEERFERIEHVTGGLVEQFRLERDENRQLWRNSQRQIEALTVNIDALGDKISRLAEESIASDKRLEARIEQLAAEARAEDKRLGERIDTLVSAIGKMLEKK